MTKKNLRECMICGANEVTEIISVKNAPKYHVISPSTKLSERLFGSINLVQCDGCGHIFNNSLVENGESLDTEFYLTNTPISDSMIARHEHTVDFLTAEKLRKLRVLDVGAGSGALAATFAKHGHGVTVVEPSSMIDKSSLMDLDVNVINDRWPTSALAGEKFDLILCVQVFEHIDSPREFLANLIGHLAVNGRIYLEIPSGDWVIKNASLIDVHFPHLNYYLDILIKKIVRELSLSILEIREQLNGRDIGYVLSKSDSQTMNFQDTQSDRLAPRLFEDNLRTANKKLLVIGSKFKFAIYGANAGSQAFFGFFPNATPSFVFDDTASYAGASAYGPSGSFPIFQTASELLKKIDVVLIAAYVHDKDIFEKLKMLNFRGQILSLRPAFDQSGKVESLFA